jgi:hypothetical protein
MTTATAPNYLTSDQLAALLHVSKKGLLLALYRGEIPQPLRVGRRRLWLENEVQEHLRKLRAESAETRPAD